jgi:hypothetical protein
LWLIAKGGADSCRLRRYGIAGNNAMLEYMIRINKHNATARQGEGMTDTSKEAGVIMALEDRFEKQRLPRLLSLKDKVDGGGVLDDPDIEFLEQVINDAMHSKPLMDRHPEWQSFCAYVVHLYEEITEMALRNEEKRRPAG